MEPRAQNDAVSFFLKDASAKNGTRIHSADAKHQSLSMVLFTAPNNTSQMVILYSVGTYGIG